MQPTHPFPYLGAEVEYKSVSNLIKDDFDDSYYYEKITTNFDENKDIWHVTLAPPSKTIKLLKSRIKSIPTKPQCLCGQ